jgi:hypothetical protein
MLALLFVLLFCCFNWRSMSFGIAALKLYRDLQGRGSIIGNVIMHITDCAFHRNLLAA